MWWYYIYIRLWEFCMEDQRVSTNLIDTLQFTRWFGELVELCDNVTLLAQKHRDECYNNYNVNVTASSFIFNYYWIQVVVKYKQLWIIWIIDVNTWVLCHCLKESFDNDDLTFQKFVQFSMEFWSTKWPTS